MQGANELIRKFQRLGGQHASQMVLTAVHQGAKFVQAEAKLRAPANTGELRQSIKTRAKLEGNIAVGEVFVGVEHGIYVEFGTGPKGAANHSGISSEINVSYRSTPWYVHESQIDVGSYHFAKRGEFYKMYGQPAQPYLYPALKDNEKKVQKIVANYVNKKIEELAR